MPLFERANSSPNLRGRSRYGQHDDYDNFELAADEEFFVIGDRVQVDGHRPGSVAYFGETEFGLGDWVGVVLDAPTGNHDGRLHGRQYFQCAPNRGLFVRPHRVARLADSALGSSAASSRCATPLPTANNTYQRFRYSANGGGGAKLVGRYNSGWSTRSSSLASPAERSSSRASTGSSQLGSYYYDDDYRQERAPTVESLARKLKLIDAEAPARSTGAHATNRDDRPMSRTPTPVGILKHPNSGAAGQLTSSRVDELNRRLRTSSASASGAGADARSVFSFRPKREQLDAPEAFGDSGDSGGAAGAAAAAARRQRSIDLFGIAEPPRKGDRVAVRTEREGQLTGLLRFMGETNFATGEWAGVELDEPVGKNDGAILGVRYFHCPPGYGLFVPATRVKKCHPATHTTRLTSEQYRPHGDLGRLSGSQPSIFNTMRSTIKSPPPPRPTASRLSHQSGYSSTDGTRSTTPSYNTDTLSSTPISMAAGSGGTKLQPDYLSGSTSPVCKTTNLDDFSALSPSPEPPRRNWSSGSQLDNSPNAYDKWRLAPRAPKFDDRDIELKLKQSLNRSRPLAANQRSSSTASLVNRPKAVEYTFISSKLDGEPIARRTLIYD